jgi:hypothetical protein
VKKAAATLLMSNTEEIQIDKDFEPKSPEESKETYHSCHFEQVATFPYLGSDKKKGSSRRYMFQRNITKLNIFMLNINP